MFNKYAKMHASTGVCSSASPWKSGLGGIEVSSGLFAPDAEDALEECRLYFVYCVFYIGKDQSPFRSLIQHIR